MFISVLPRLTLLILLRQPLLKSTTCHASLYQSLYNLVLKLELERKFQNKNHGRQNFQKLLASYNTHFEGNDISG
jgi:uncharacterized protein YjbK